MEKTITKKKQLGNYGEDAVSSWLIEKGFSIIAKNYNTRLGEIDIIARRGELVTFVEVKTRQTVYFPISSTVNFRKQQKLIKTAKHFVAKNNISDTVFRFDIATVVAHNNECKINYIENAFMA